MTGLFPFPAGSVVLFQGDSITDAGRSREHDADPGRGYVLMASALYAARYPGVAEGNWRTPHSLALNPSKQNGLNVENCLSTAAMSSFCAEATLLR
ncbi:MAG: hypothetical protein J7639_05535 [Paenibacillaceae bacterium]|nr:hypothetical protein [Paenibacillaceae bacterium]